MVRGSSAGVAWLTLSSLCCLLAGIFWGYFVRVNLVKTKQSNQAHIPASSHCHPVPPGSLRSPARCSQHLICRKRKSSCFHCRVNIIEISFSKINIKFLGFLFIPIPQSLGMTDSEVHVPSLETICSKGILKYLFKTKTSDTFDTYLFFKKKNPNLPRGLWAQPYSQMNYIMVLLEI